ncbi:hypothetical protein DPMN_032653 [Dreissena polymorpha]|uniref:Uncharacterized protein n=1 Tax=Dreissena polymorpha TaxID=45954 RepID=A0A9D4M547_DREPO|nr:hypothetical protein DPMN_032653 [Dreissena polymorpha]
MMDRYDINRDRRVTGVYPQEIITHERRVRNSVSPSRRRIMSNASRNIDDERDMYDQGTSRRSANRSERYERNDSRQTDSNRWNSNRIDGSSENVYEELCRDRNERYSRSKGECREKDMVSEGHPQYE